MDQLRTGLYVDNLHRGVGGCLNPHQLHKETTCQQTNSRERQQRGQNVSPRSRETAHLQSQRHALNADSQWLLQLTIQPMRSKQRIVFGCDKTRQRRCHTSNQTYFGVGLQRRLEQLFLCKVSERHLKTTFSCNSLEVAVCAWCNWETETRSKFPRLPDLKNKLKLHAFTFTARSFWSKWGNCQVYNCTCKQSQALHHYFFYTVIV